MREPIDTFSQTLLGAFYGISDDFIRCDTAEQTQERPPVPTDPLHPRRLSPAGANSRGPRQPTPVARVACPGRSEIAPPAPTDARRLRRLSRQTRNRAARANPTRSTRVACPPDGQVHAPLAPPNGVKYPSTVMMNPAADPSSASRLRRDRERAGTRQLILDAAREMFVSEGYEGTTMRAIAQRIEYTPTAIYHHFASKEALLQELCDQDFGALGRALHQIGGVADPVERVTLLGTAYVEFGLAQPMHYRFMFMTQRPPLVDNTSLRRGDPSEDAYAFLRDTCAELIVSGRTRPECQDAEALAQILWAGLHGIISLYMTKGQDEWIDFRDPRQLSAQMREVLLRGILK
jgi:AcrR family transcriptional regulator